MAPDCKAVGRRHNQVPPNRRNLVAVRKYIRHENRALALDADVRAMQFFLDLTNQRWRFQASADSDRCHTGVLSKYRIGLERNYIGSRVEYDGVDIGSRVKLDRRSAFLG